MRKMIIIMRDGKVIKTLSDEEMNREVDLEKMFGNKSKNKKESEK